MEQERVVIKRLRLANGLSAKATARLISKSAGWLSEIENGTGRSVLRPRDYKKIYDLLNGDKYKRHFGAWMKQANADKKLQRQSQSLDGAIYKFLREQKAKLSIRKAAKQIGFSPGYLSRIENGHVLPSPEMKAKIIKVYGYSPSSWKNFATDDKRGKAIPIEFRLKILMQQLTPDEVLKVFNFAQHLKSVPDT